MTEGNRIYSYVLLHLRSDYSGAVQPPAWQRSGMGGRSVSKLHSGAVAHVRSFHLGMVWCFYLGMVFLFRYNYGLSFGYALFIRVWCVGIVCYAIFAI